MGATSPPDAGRALCADLGDQHVGRAAHVQSQQSARAIGIARNYRFHHLTQFPDEIAFTGRRRRRAPVIAQFLDLQHLPYPAEPYTVAARYQVVEKRMVQSHESTIKTPLSRPGLERRRARQLMERRDDARFPADITRGDRLAKAEFFDFDTRGGQIAQILRRDRRDAEAALRSRLHQTLGSESRQRFAYSTLTGFEPFAQFADTQRFSGFETTVEQVVPQLVVGTLGQARPVPSGRFGAAGLADSVCVPGAFKMSSSSKPRLRALSKSIY